MIINPPLQIYRNVLSSSVKDFDKINYKSRTKIPFGQKTEPLKNDIVQISKNPVSEKSSSGFKSKEEIIKYFQNMGIDVRIENFSDKHLETFNLIREDIKILKKMGLEKALPERICLSDWRDVEKTRQITSEYGLDIEFPPDRRAYCGASSNTIFINSSEDALKNSNGVFRKFKHEIGHRMHFTYCTPTGILESNGANSVLGESVEDNIEFANRQLQVLGIDEKVCKIMGYPLPYNITSPINKRYMPLQNKTVLDIDVTKMITYMNDKCHCYNKTYLSEQVAEIFEDLLKERKFDDLTMLMYDFAGGGRIPNLRINGKKYDDYIKSLYENKELVNKLKEFIVIR